MGKGGTSNNAAGANTAGGSSAAPASAVSQKPTTGVPAGGKGGAAPSGSSSGYAPAGSPQAGGPSSPYAQAQSMYSQPFMQMFGGSGGVGQPQGQMPGPYSYSPYSVQGGYNPQALTQSMNQYYTPIPQQMPQSPYLAGYQWGANGPPSNPAQGSNMPLSPMLAGQLPNSILPSNTPSTAAAPTTPATAGLSSLQAGSPGTYTWGGQTYPLPGYKAPTG